MGRVRSFLLVIVALVVANVVSFINLSHNVVTEVYPIEADSIVIALVEGLIMSSHILIFLCVAILIPRNKIGSVISLLLGGFGTFLAVVYTLMWAMPDHYAMALAYGCVAIVGGILARGYVRQLTAPVAA